MILDRLRKLVGKKGDVDALLAKFRAETGDEDLASFAAHLRREALITPNQLRELLTTEEVSFTVSEARLSADVLPVSRHDLLGLLGKGAMGEVHIARDRVLHRNVAFKIMDPRVAREPILARRFHTEVQVTAQLDHPSIVSVYGLEVGSDGAVGYAMKLIRGKTLKQWLAECQGFYDKGGRPDEEHDLHDRLELFLQICNAMHYAHSRGVIHRDLKPDNIMVGQYHEVIVMDWGIARLVGGHETLEAEPGGAPRLEASEDPTVATQIGTAIGTPAYMSPEQALAKNDELDARSDQFSIGLLLFELVALRRAITGNSMVEVFAKAMHGRVDPVKHYSPKERVPRELVAIIHKATARDPKGRYPDVEALADDVRRYMRDEAVLARPDGPAQRVQRWISHHRQATMLTGFALVLLVIAVGAVSIVGGLAALQVAAWQAEAREQALGEVMTATTGGARSLDSEFQRQQANLAGLAAQAEYLLAHEPPADIPYYVVADFHTEGRQPPDLAPSTVYEGSPLSLAHPDNALAPGLDAAAMDGKLRQLNALQPLMLRMILESGGGDVPADAAGQRALIAEKGLPMVWTYVAVEEGLLTGMPGVGEYPDSYDPRNETWYGRGRLADPFDWDVGDDESGQGLLVTCVTRVRKPDGGLAGVAALDLSVRHVAEKLLHPPSGLQAPMEAILLDGLGRVVSRSSGVATAGDAVPYEHPEVVEALLRGQRAGHLELESDAGPLLIAWSPLEVVGWTYLLVGDADALLGG